MNSPAEDGTQVDHELDLIRAAQCEARALSGAGGLSTPRDAIPGFEITDEIGRGGMGVVYRALQLSTKRVVALKVMLAGAFASRSARQRFQREVELTARFRHPGIVRVLESGLTATGQPYYAMDHVEAVRLDEWVRSKRVDVPALLRVFADICRAVAHAHEHGVIHRDLKPANVLVDTEAKPHVLDFGLSKAMVPDGANSQPSLSVSMPGQVVGTLRYLAPEQTDGNSSEIDAQTDVYAVGVMLYEALTGRLPTDAARSPSDTIQRIREQQPEPPASLSHRVDRELQTIVLKALEKEKRRRYASIEELGADIERYLANEPIIARPASSLYVLRRKLFRQRARISVAALAVALGLCGLWCGTWWRDRALQRQHAQGLAAARRDVAGGQHKMEEGLLEEALRLVEVALAQYPDLTEAHLLYAQVHFRMGQDLNRRDMMLAAMDDLESDLANDQRAWAQRALLGEMHNLIGEHDEADVLTARARAEAPDTAEAWYLRSFATFDPLRAADCVRQAITREPSRVLFWVRRAQLALLLGDYEEACTAARKLMAIDRASRAGWLFFEGGARMRQSHWADAVDSYTEALAMSGDAVSIYRNRGTAHICMGDYPRALADYSTAVDLTGRQGIWERHKRALAYWLTGRLDEAADDYREVRRLLGHAAFSDVRLFLVLHDQARLLEVANRDGAAAQTRAEAWALQAAVCAAGDTDDWLRQIFDCLTGKIEPQALVSAAEAVDPPNLERRCEAYYYAGEACRLARRAEEAEAWFRKCADTNLALEPYPFRLDPMYEYHLARWRLGTSE